MSTFPGKQPEATPGQIGLDNSILSEYSGDMTDHLTAQPGECFKAGIVKRIHVDQHAIKSFVRGDGLRPCITIQLSSGPRKCHEVAVHGKSRIVARLDDPLSCGARVWIETTARVEVLR